ncbi:MAG: glycoside hydrolase family 43 protein, partial [Firmicutes bacterium]|nr:glycoside hydrolase family 43 protein [Bacillota bacterium]
MRKKILIMLSMVLIMFVSITISYADNPIVQTIYTADPAPLVYNDTVYLYTGHDEDNATGFLMKDYRCFTTTDMVNWTDHGIAMFVTAFSWASQVDSANAAQVIYRNGKFYYYAALSGGNIGVGVSTSPTGPFTDALGHPLIYHRDTDFPGYATHGWRNLDPTVFIDDDGQAYMYWGNNALYYVKLNSDMISYSGPITYFPLTTAAFGDDYEEAPWLYKRNGLYYLAFASFIPERICYSTSASPTGPWTYRGVIMNAQSDCAGNHPGIIDYKGNSYLFGFNRALLRLTSTENYERRSVCVDKFTYNADGTIPTLPSWSTSGPPQIGTLNPYVRTEAETICWETGVETEKCSEGGMNVSNIENGDWIKVKGVNFGSGATSFEARVATATSGGNIEIRLDSPTGTLVGTCAVSGTGGWQTWVTRSCTISGASGIHDLYFRFTGGSGSLFNFNWWKFYGSGITPSVTPTPAPTTGPRSAFSQIEAESYNSQSGVQTESCGEGGQNIGYIENGDYVVYNNVD